MDTLAVALALGADKKGAAAAEQAQRACAAVAGPEAVMIGIDGPFQMFHAESSMLSATSLEFDVVLTKEGRDTADLAKADLLIFTQAIQRKIAEAGEAILVVDASSITGVLPYGLGFTVKSLTTHNTFSQNTHYFGLVSARIVLDATSLGLGVIDKEVLAKFYSSDLGGDVIFNNNTAGDGKYHAILPLTFSLT